MPWFYDACVNRTDSYFMNLLSPDLIKIHLPGTGPLRVSMLHGRRKADRLEPWMPFRYDMPLFKHFAFK